MDSIFVCADQFCQQHSDALELYRLKISRTIDCPPWRFTYISCLSEKITTPYQTVTGAAFVIMILCYQNDEFLKFKRIVK